jgi:hypothetical protein
VDGEECQAVRAKGFNLVEMLLAARDEIERHSGSAGTVPNTDSKGR